MFKILNFIQKSIIILFLPIYLFLFYILSKYHFINGINIFDWFSYFYYFTICENFSSIFSRPTPTITFMIPYIKFVNYPKEYNCNWFWDLIKPKPSPFIETMNEDIYKTWNGEALINFKWNTFGRYYYRIIWILFMAFIGCFTVAATTPQQYIDKGIQNQLLIASIILGFIHLSFEIRQIIYNPIKWIRDFWNIFGMFETLNIYF